MDERPIKIPTHQIVMIFLGYFISVGLFFKGMYDVAMQLHGQLFHHTFHKSLWLAGVYRMGTAIFFMFVLLILFYWTDKLHEKEVTNNHIQ